MTNTHSSTASRRTFMRTAGGLAALSFLPAMSYTHSLRKNVGQIRIAEVHAYPVRRACYAKVVADDGTEGWGECGHDGVVLVARLVNREIRPLVLGRDVFDADPTWSRIYFDVNELGPSGLIAQAIAGVDCALWDLRGKLLGMPVWKLLGGKYRDRIPLYGTFSRSKGRGEFMTPAECAAEAAALVEEGFSAIKVRLGIREQRADPVPDPAIPVMREVRKAVGDKIELYIDANNGYSPKQAILVGKQVHEEFNVVLFEEPVAAHNYPSLAQVAKALDIPVSAGEHEYTKWQFRDLILQGKVDVLNPDLSKLAGITEGMKVAALAEIFDLPISVHNARPTLLTAAHLHYCAAVFMARRTQEHPKRERLTELWQFFKNRFVVKNGYLEVPDTPGLGLIPDEDAIKRAEIH